jgi:phage replication O-like protein O
MTSPQVENGYTRIANELLEAIIQSPIGFGNAQIFWAVVRKTYGFRKKNDYISISQLQEMTGLSRRMTIYCVQNLEAKKMIKVKRRVGRGHKKEINHIEINKNYTEWVVQEKSNQYDKALKTRKIHYKNKGKVVVQEGGGSARNRKRVVQETKKKGRFLAPTKETITKETITKEKEECSDFSENEKSNPPPSKEKSSKKKNIQYEQKHFQLAVKLKRVIRERVPFQKIGKNDAENWANVIRLMEEQDKIPVELIEKIIDFIRIDDFWGTNIRSGSKLRKQFGVLHAQMDRERKPKKRLNPVTGQWEDASKWSQP